jgi:hypothetical protein
MIQPGRPGRRRRTAQTLPRVQPDEPSPTEPTPKAFGGDAPNVCRRRKRGYTVSAASVIPATPSTPQSRVQP